MSLLNTLFTSKAVLVLNTPPSIYTDALSASTSLTSLTSSALSGSSSSGSSAGTYSFTVQYNPTSISYNANAQAVPFQYLQQNMDQGIPNMDTRPPSVVMSVDLCFDDMNVSDAFASETFSVDSISDAVDTVAAAVGSFSVQPQTNGLLAAVMSEITRTVTFRWGDMSFTGELAEVRARYTMFSTSGAPIRSVVTISLIQQVSSGADNELWDEIFDTAFGDSSSSASSSVASTSITSLV